MLRTVNFTCYSYLRKFQLCVCVCVRERERGEVGRMWMRKRMSLKLSHVQETKTQAKLACSEVHFLSFPTFFSLPPVFFILIFLPQ